MNDILAMVLVVVLMLSIIYISIGVYLYAGLAITFIITGTIVGIISFWLLTIGN